ALTSARRTELRDLAEEGNAQAGLAARLAEDSMRVLSSYQLAHTLIVFLIAVLIAALLLPPFTAWIVSLGLLPLVGLLVGYLVVIPLAALIVFAITSLIPTMIVQKDANRWAIMLARPAQVLLTLSSPLVVLMAGLRQVLARPFGGEAEAGAVTEEEIMTMIDAGQEVGSIEAEEKEMIYSIFQLDETLVREIMIPRIDMVALDVDTPLREARQVIIDAGHSRIPVYDDSLDHIIGLLYAKDLIELWHRADDVNNLTAVVRPARFVPETKRVSDLLRELQSAKVHMAIVIDEYGGTAGLVTIEDIVEEIVGEILDEYDEPEETLFEQIGDNEFMVDGMMNLDDLQRLLAVDLPEEHGEDTLGGLILWEMGKVPEQGEAIETGRLSIQVMSVVDRRIRKVRIKRLAAPDADSTPPKGTKINGLDSSN
ncbi:MAG: HlyC/CorC family transporter, partial [Anaerolineae bacterium]|nr:HlyC/CorC family transporter [Anaerolineae bacterium]